jgi:catechol-2,3-dioxygenase
MGIFQLNHAVLFVDDLKASVEFYSDVLGFEPIKDMSGMSGAAFLRAADSTNDHDLGLFEIQGGTPSLAGRATVGLYHLAWEVDTLGTLEQLQARLTEVGALVGATDHGTTKSLYGKDPSALEFEIVWLIPAELITEDDRSAAKRLGRLDLDKEIARFGRDTRGGVGISRSTVPA